MKYVRAMRRAIRVGLDAFVVILMMALVADVVWGIASRLCQIPSRWTEEVAGFLLMWLSLFGAAAAFERREHLGVDYLVQKLDSQAHGWLRVIASLSVLLFVVWVFIWGGLHLVHQALASSQRTAATGLPMGYVYLAVPVSGLLFALFAMEQAVGATGDMRGKES
jgi:TRAP-type C4-dicarboxylate transport system permease small subunit